MSDLIIDRVSKSYGENRLFNDFNTRFREGATVITGPSGCGKTTLLRMICGLETPDAGKITGGGFENCAVMFGEPRLFGSLTALGNVTAVVPDAEAEAKAGLQRAGFTPDDMNKYPAELSDGMRQRVALIRALCFAVQADRHVILLDEPLKSLDRELKLRLSDDIFAAAAGRILIIVSHDPEVIGKFGEENWLSLNRT